MNDSSEDPISLYKRFLDDIFMVWKGSLAELQEFLSEINKIHPTIKFTAEFTSPFPCDTTVSATKPRQFHFWTPVCQLKGETFQLTSTESQLTGASICSPVAATPPIL